MNLNKVYLIGRLTQNPEAKSAPSGQNVCTFGLATSRVWNNPQTKERQEKTEFHNIVLWGRIADIATQYLTKGSLVMIDGRLQTRSWQDQQGNKKYRTEIVGENIQMGPRSASTGNKNFGPSQAQEQPKNIPVAEEIPIIEEESDEEINVKDIPF
jgi:single-strand DNA-binding protein